MQPARYSKKRVYGEIFTVFFTLLIIFPSIVVYANQQTPNRVWQQTFGPYMSYSVIQTEDGGYLIAGQNATYDSRGYNYYSPSIIKTDSSSQTQWKSVLDVGGYAISVVQTKDLGYFVGCKPNGLLFKLDSQGNVQWNKTFGLSSCYIIQTSDRDYVIAGSQRNANNGADVVLVRINENGEELWNKTFNFGFLTLITTFKQSADDSYVLSGETNWFAKVDSNGNLLWNQSYNLPEAGTKIGINQIANTNDGGYVLIGYDINGAGALLLKTDVDGKIQWSKRYENASFSSIIQDLDGGFVGAGLDQSSNYALTKLDYQGKMLWTVCVDGNPSSLIVTSDGAYVVSGTASSSGLADIFLAKYLPQSTFQSTAPQEYTPTTFWILIAVLVLAFLGIGLLFYIGRQKR
jgi:hypothetical protein